MENAEYSANVRLPRVAITYCTQCRWMLRAAYFGQELLSTFSTSIGEIALIPATGGIFTVHLMYKPEAVSEDDSVSTEPKKILIWDRKTEGGFPETKILKQKIRNIIEPGKNLGHSDTPSSKTNQIDVTSQDRVRDNDASGVQVAGQTESNDAPVRSKEACEDCS